MNTVPWSPSLWPAAACAEALAQLGFAPVAGGYQRGEFRLTLGPHWCALEAPCANPGDDLLGDLSQPGLWKHCRADEQPRRVFALPAALVRGAPPSDVGDESAPSVLQRCARWALQTAGPFSVLDWQAPARDVVESWFAPEQLTVVAGALVRQGELSPKRTDSRSVFRSCRIWRPACRRRGSPGCARCSKRAKANGTWRAWASSPKKLATAWSPKST